MIHNTAIEVGKISIVNKVISDWGVNSILVITSPSIAKFDEVKELIEQLKINNDVEIFSQIKPDAPLLDLDEIVQNHKKPDAIIAIGGGSVIDSAKALSVAWKDASISEMFYQQKSIPATKIKTIAIPTTAGTGAELSYGAILYDVKNKLKGGLRGSILQPNHIIIDIDLYSKAPKKLIAEVGFDCLTHAIETYLSTASTPFVRYQSVAAIQVVFGNLFDAYNGRRESLEKVAIAATLMGRNLALSTTCLPHRIQYAVGPVTNTSHAVGLIMLYRGWLPIISKTVEFQKLSADLNMTTNQLVDKVENLKKDMNVDYRLSEYDVTNSDTELIAEKVTGNVKNDPAYQSIETIKLIIQNSI